MIKIIKDIIKALNDDPYLFGACYIMLLFWSLILVAIIF
jgi:hypothetical protein